MKLIVVLFALLTTVSFAKDSPVIYTVSVTDDGFEPNNLKVKAGVPLTFKITRKTNATCAREFTIPSQKLKVDLPLNKEVTVNITALTKGAVKFGCAMDMMIGGVMHAE